MRTSKALIAVTCAFSTIHSSCGFWYAPGLNAGRGRPALNRKRGIDTASARPPCSACSGLRPAGAAAAAAEAGGGDIVLAFKPSEIEVVCKPGEVVLEVAQRCSGMVEDSKNPFCRDGGCYNCEVEVVEATELGLEDNLVRACLFKVPEGVQKMTLVQMTSEEAFEDMV